MSLIIKIEIESGAPSEIKELENRLKKEYEVTLIEKKEGLRKNTIKYLKYQLTPIERQKAGRKEKLTPQQIKKLITEHAAGDSLNTLAKRYGVCKSSVQNYIKNAKNHA